jgi:hypothetical protein
MKKVLCVLIAILVVSVCFFVNAQSTSASLVRKTLTIAYLSYNFQGSITPKCPYVQPPDISDAVDIGLSVPTAYVEGKNWTVTTGAIESDVSDYWLKKVVSFTYPIEVEVPLSAAPGTYKLVTKITGAWTCTGGGGRYTGFAQQSFNIVVPGTPSCTLQFNPNPINVGSNTTAYWTSQNDADDKIPYSCTGDLNNGTLSPANSNAPVSPGQTQTCTLTVANDWGVSSSCSAKITVNPLAPPPLTCSLTSNHGDVLYNNTFTLSWTSNGDLVTANGFDNTGRGTNDSVIISSAPTTGDSVVYGITCRRGSESTTASTLVRLHKNQLNVDAYLRPNGCDASPVNTMGNLADKVLVTYTQTGSAGATKDYTVKPGTYDPWAKVPFSITPKSATISDPNYVYCKVGGGGMYNDAYNKQSLTIYAEFTPKCPGPYCGVPPPSSAKLNLDAAVYNSGSCGVGNASSMGTDAGKVSFSIKYPDNTTHSLGVGSYNADAGTYKANSASAAGYAYCSVSPSSATFGSSDKTMTAYFTKTGVLSCTLQASPSQANDPPLTSTLTLTTSGGSGSLSTAKYWCDSWQGIVSGPGKSSNLCTYSDKGNFSPTGQITDTLTGITAQCSASVNIGSAVPPPPQKVRSRLYYQFRTLSGSSIRTWQFPEPPGFSFTVATPHSNSTVYKNANFNDGDTTNGISAWKGTYSFKSWNIPATYKFDHAICDWGPGADCTFTSDWDNTHTMTVYLSDNAVEPPGGGDISCTLNAVPKFGPAPLGVSFQITDVLGGSGNYQYSFDYGDGHSASYPAANPSSHTYAGEGSYTAKGSVKDDAGKIGSCKDIVGNDITITVNPPTPSGCTFTASPSSVLYGQSSTLTWSCTPIDTDRDCTITKVSNGSEIATGSQSGSVKVKPTSETQYNLHCTEAPVVGDSQATVKVGFIPVIREIIPR